MNLCIGTVISLVDRSRTGKPSDGGDFERTEVLLLGETICEQVSLSRLICSIVTKPSITVFGFGMVYAGEFLYYEA